MMRIDWTGIFSVLVTPFADDGALDLPRFDALLERNLATGADGLIVLGSTGEFYTLSREEKVTLIRRTVAGAKGRAPVLVGTADIDPAESLAIASAAEAAGADGLLVLPPIYAMPDRRETEHFFRTIAGATRLPIMLYNSPRRTGISVSPDVVASLIDLPTVAAIKDSSGDIDQVAELVRRFGDTIAVFVGYETMVRAGLERGIRGVVAMAHQTSSGLVRRFYDACAAGDAATADALEPALLAIYDCFKLGSYYAGIKEVMAALGVPAGPPRPPLLPFTEAQKAAVAARLAEGRVAETIRSLATKAA